MDDPSKKLEDDNGSPGKLLEPQERLICEQIATGVAPHSQRAQALLALDAGETEAEASRMSGLSDGQVKYWLARFRNDRMNIFPSESPEVDQQVEQDARSKKEESDAAEAETKAKTVKKDKKKDKKDKKKKAKKKDKKGKKKKAKKKDKKGKKKKGKKK